MKKFFASLATGALALSIAAPAFAADSARGEAMTHSSKAAVVIDSACMQNAVDKRDSAISDGVDAYAAAVKTALATRKDALKAAWALTDKTQRNAALKAAWSAFNGTWKKAAAAMKATKRAAWTNFNADAKACKQPGADAAGAGTDAQL